MAAPVLSKKGTSGWRVRGFLWGVGRVHDGVFTFSIETDQLMTNPKGPPGKDKLQKTFLEKDQTAKFSWESMLTKFAGSSSLFFFQEKWNNWKPSCFVFLSDELTRLWNLNHDNMEACKSDSRSVGHFHLVKWKMTSVCIIEDVTFLSREFMPSLDEFFAEAIEQADPANMVEDEYKYVWAKTLAPLSLSCGCVSLLALSVNHRRAVRNPNYGWRALRLLSRRSPHFFQPTNQKFKSLADYLDSMVSKLAKELPVRRCEKPFVWLWKKICYLWGHSLTLTFLHRVQKDIPSEEIKTGEEDDDDNGDNLLKDSNDSELVIHLGSVLWCGQIHYWSP